MPDIFPVTSNGWKKTPATKSRGPYATDRRDQWVSYDDVSSARAKAEYVRENNLGGAALWTADLDDFNNLCCLGPNPVTRAVSSVLRGVHASPATPGCGRPPPVSTPRPFVPTTTEDSGGGWTEPKPPKPPKKKPEGVADSVDRPPPQFEPIVAEEEEEEKEKEVCPSQLVIAGQVQTPALFQVSCQEDYLPHETDCSKFYRCMGGKRVINACHNDLVWNQKRKTCDWKYNVDCDKQRFAAPGAAEEVEDERAEDEVGECLQGQYVGIPDDCSRYMVLI